MDVKKAKEGPWLERPPVVSGDREFGGAAGIEPSAVSMISST